MTLPKFIASAGNIESPLYLSWHADRLFVWWRIPWWFQRQRRTEYRILWLTTIPYGALRTKSERWLMPFWASVSGISPTASDVWPLNWSWLSPLMMMLSAISAANSQLLPTTRASAQKDRNSHSIFECLNNRSHWPLSLSKAKNLSGQQFIISLFGNSVSASSG